MRDKLLVIVTDELCKHFNDPIDIECSYCEAAKAVIPLVRADMQRDTVALLKNLRRDIWLIRGMAKSKSMFPYDMCREILSITKRSLEDIRSELKSGTFKEGE